MKKWLVMLMSAVAILSCAACSTGAGDGGDGGTGNTPPPQQVVNGIVSLNSFDSQDVMDRLMLRGVLGKVELNTEDTEFIKSGVGSAKVTVISNPYKSGQPTLYQATEFFKTNEDYSDFTKASRLTLWVYNAQTVQKRIGLQLVYSADSVDMIEWRNVAPQTWTNLSLNIEREYLTVGSNGKATVRGINVIFNRGGSDEVYYLDEFSLVRTDTPYTPVNMTLAENELCSFDKYWQLKKLTLGCWGSLELAPSVTWVADITSTGKGQAIRVETVPTELGDRWPYIALGDAFFSLIDLSKYNGKDRLCFDVYSPQLNGMDQLWMELYDESGAKYFTSDAKALTVGQWTTISFNVEALRAAGNFEKTKELRILHKWYSGDAKIFYVDNIRMEPANS